MFTPDVAASLILLIGIILGIVFAVPIAVAIGMASFLAIIVISYGDVGVASMNTAAEIFTGINSFTLLAIPFFILAGVIMNQGGIAGRLIDAAMVLVGRAPGGLAHTNVVANSLFGAVSGAAVAAAAAIGTIMNPRLVQQGYNKPFAAAVNVASAPSGMLIPPSNTFIVYSLVSSTSIAALFMAGVGPGLVWVLACMAMVMIFQGRNRTDTGVVQPRLSVGQALLVIWRAVPSLLMIVIVVGGILGGFFTATESSAIAVVYCLILSFVYRTISVKQIPAMLVDAGRTTAIVMLLVGVSSALSFVMAYARIPELISNLLGFTDSPTVILLIMMLVLLVVGTFMDPTPAILIFVPIFLPIVQEFGIDPIHFGTMVVYNRSVGVITPPVGNVLFVGARIAGLKIEPVVAKLIPFLLAIIGGLLVVVFVPQISMWLPSVTGQL